MYFKIRREFNHHDEEEEEVGTFERRKREL